MNMTSTRLYSILFIIQFVFIAILFLQNPDEDQQANFEKQIEELKFQNQETKNLLLSIKANSSSTQDSPLTEISDNHTSQINETPGLTPAQVTLLVEDRIESILSEKLSAFREDIQRNTSMTQPSPIPGAFPTGMQNPVISTNKKYIDKEYDSIEDEDFKSNLMLADEIIDRAIDAGVFTEWDAEELNVATENLEFEQRVFIMNKLSHAYNSQKIKGKFINFKLVNRSSEN